MKTLRFLFGVVCAVALLSCAKNNPDGPAVDPVPLTLSEAQISYVSSGNAFSANLLTEVNKANAGKDYFFSPLSVQMLLSMLMNGTDGAAFTELTSALGYGQDLAAVNDYCRQMIERSPTWDPKVKLALANAMIGDDRFNFKSAFTETLETYFSAEVSSQDFSKTDKVRDYINGWCKNKTNGMIDKMIDSFDPSIVICLMNALYFKGEWAFPFEPAKTKKEPFTKENGISVNVDMMNATLSLGYAQSQTWKAASIPFGNGTYSMRIILPEGDATTNDIVSEIKAAGWQAFNSTGTGQMRIKLPKFETSFADMGMEAEIKALGVSGIFQGGCFQKITEDKDFKISTLIQKARIKVYEEGAEAAAATINGGFSSPAPAPDFYCDRPFIYAIVENTTGAVFFMGKYGACEN